MFAVAIDGPSGAGKSTVSKAVADKLGFIYVDTGALYRTVGLYLIGKGIEPDNEKEIIKVLPNINIEMKHTENGQCMYLNGEDVTNKIRTQEVSNAASVSSTLKSVRKFLFEMQTEMAKKYNVIMDGRDIGAVVLPHAQVKIFLTATPEERAERRMNQLKEQGVTADDYETILADIKERDYRDSNREIAPLKPCENAVIVDSTGNEMYQTVDIIENIVREKM